ncbi:helix-turn-helix domain-containing protein [Bacillus pseudomycoides]|uniref:helix-turn-helix domain-containing protein n=1 Tax=Bacillus pseudomycoides TaxID=64104 RepID=UPI00050070F6|nr:helix-turn-helix domain-containing protein [Bacillus pseudomycoides]KFN12826.1 helix-turn-helix family protein [Bacillus pseudomycoides]MED0855681.1 transcriptional regulator [Bacillus pseudomycoides]
MDKNYKYRELLIEEQNIENEMNGIEREMKKTWSRELIEKQKKLYAQYTSLCRQTNSGNLRHVIYSLYTERGLSMKEFANELGVKESAIQNILRKGIITEKLLDTICTYFQINKTQDFMRYIAICDCCNRNKGTYAFTFSPYEETIYYCEKCHNELVCSKKVFNMDVM